MPQIAEIEEEACYGRSNLQQQQGSSIPEEEEERLPPRIPRRRRQRPPNCNESRVAVSGIIRATYHRDLPTTTRDLLPFFFFSVWRFITLFGRARSEIYRNLYACGFAQTDPSQGVM